MAKEIGTIEEALQDLRDGKVILVIDDPERENEGDLICAAEFATQENVNFMACEAKGGLSVASFSSPSASSASSICLFSSESVFK